MAKLGQKPARANEQHLLKPLFSALQSAFRKTRPNHPSPSPRCTSPAANASRKQIHFEPIEPRVLLSADVNPAALTIGGSIDVPGEQDRFEFTLQETTRVVFDSLTNRGDLTWSLDGPAGRVDGRSFSNTDGYSYAGNPAYELSAGKYTLTVDGSGDATGAYALRAIDASTAADLTPGVAVAGTLDGGNKTAVYRFNANAGDKFYFDGISASGGTVYWRLVDPFGRQERSLSSIQDDQDTFSTQCNGSYLLLVEGYTGNTAAASYSFNLRPVQDTTVAMSLDTVTTASIDQPGKTANFTFSVTESTPVLFDGANASGDFYWSLRGPGGMQVARRSMNSNPAFGESQYLSLAPGDYTLSVDANLATTGDVSFRLASRAATQSLALDQVTSGTLDASRGSAFYRVTLNPGKYYLEGRGVTNGAINARLIGQYGGLAISTPLTTPVAPIAISATAELWLELDGAANNDPAQPVSYEFALRQVLDSVAPLALGDVVNGALATPGQSAVYEFTLATAAQLAFDAQTNRNDLLWSLSGPRGIEVADRRFDQSDASGGMSVMNLVAGTYRLTVRGNGNASGAFAFRVLDLAAGNPVTIGTAVSGTLSPGNMSQAYRLSVAAGDQLVFDSLSVSGGTARWRVLDRFGRDVLGTNDLATDRAAFTLTTGGVYTLLVEGALTNAAAVAYQFQLNAAGNIAQTPLPAGDPLALGAVTAGTLSTTGTSKTYRFTLAQDSLVVFDGQTSNWAFTYSLLGPRGQEVNGIRLEYSDAQYGNPLLSLVAGEYALTITASYGTGSYAFQLLDAATLTDLVLGDTTSGVRTPANGTLGYRFNAVAGDSFRLAQSTGGGAWRVVDPYGRVVGTQYDYSAYPYDQTFSAAVSGTYTLLNEGNYYETGSQTLGFRLTQQAKQSSALVLNDVISGQLAGRHETAEYSILLTEPTTLVLDTLESPTARQDYIRWTISGGPGGVSRDVSRFSPVTLLPGYYTLTVRNTDGQSHPFTFRMLTRDSAIVMTPGTAVIGSLTPAGTAQLYRFNATGGQRLYFDALPTDTYSYWQLTDAFGQYVSSGDTLSDRANFTLPTTGEYLLTVYHDFRYDYAAQRNYGFNLIPEITSQGVLVLDADTPGAISQPNERVRYDFTLTAPTQILVDTWGASSDFNWSLVGPRGGEASSRSFADTSNVFSLAPGDYSFMVAASNLRTGAFNFRLTDLAAVANLSIDSATHASLVPGDRSNAFRFDLADTTELLFDAIGTANASATWRIYDASGRQRFSGDTRYDSGAMTLPGGGYYLVLNGADPARTDYDFALRKPTVKTGTAVIGDVVVGALDQPAQQARYALRIDSPTTLLFDSLTASNDLAWELSGPNGVVRYETPFDYSESGNSNALLSIADAGDYTLRVFSRSNSAGSFGFRLIDLNAIPTQALPGNQLLTLDPGNRTQAYAFDSAVGDYFSYQFDSISQGTAQVWLIGPNGAREVYPQDGRQNFSLALTPGRHVLVIQGDLANVGAVDLSFAASLARNREFALTLGTDTHSNIDAQGVTDTWTFTLGSQTKLLLDGLSGDAVAWKLFDAAGNEVDAGGRVAYPRILDLATGDYRLVVRGDTYGGTVPGSYGFRLVDLASAPVLVPDASVAGTLAATHAADIYRISVQPGDRFKLFAASADGYAGRMSLFDAQGNLVTAPNFPNAGYDLNGGTQPADYWLAIDTDFANPNATSYTLNLSRIQEAAGTAVVGDIISGSLAAPNEFHRYRITVTAPVWVIASDAGSDAGARWSLAPVGSPESWQTFPPVGIYNDLQLLNAGDYDLMVSNTIASGGGYRLQLLDLGAATALPAGGTSTLLPNGHDAVAYQVDLASVNRLHVGLDTPDAAKLSWILYRDLGTYGYSQVTSSETGISRDTSELPAGRYVLALFGSAAPTETLSYTVDVAPTPIVPLALGSVVNGAFVGAENQVDYEFSLTERTTLAFDALGGDEYFSYRIADQNGGTIRSGSFYSDAYDWSRTLDLDPGTYRLNLFRNGAAASDYQFRLGALSQFDAAELTLGVAVAGTLPLGTEATAYHFSAQPGDTISINLSALTGGDLRWRLFGPDGSTLAGPTNGSQTGLYLRKAGQYTLLVDGSFYNTTAVSYQFLVSLDSHVDPLPAGLPLGLGSVLSDQLDGASKSYRFTVSQPTLVALSGKSGDGRSLNWEVQSIEGSSWSGWFDGTPVSASVLRLDAGDYAFTVNDWNVGTGATFDLRIEDSAHAQVVVPGSDIATTDARLFKVALSAGDKLAYRVLGDSYWTLYGPDFYSRTGIWSGNTDFDTYEVTESGDYYLVLADDYSPVPTDATLELRLVSDRLSPYTLGTTAEGALDGSANDVYTFTVDATKNVLLDLLYSSSNRWGSAAWSLAKDGIALANGNWYGGSGGSDANPVFNLAPGTYSLKLEGQGVQYGLRLVDLAQAANLTIAADTAGTILPGEAAVFKFDALAGDSVTYLPVDTAGVSGVWRLVDGAGQVLSDWNNLGSDNVIRDIPSSGTYYLIWDTDGYAGATAAAYSFRFNKITPSAPSALSLNTPITDTFGEDGRLKYEFASAGASLLWPDYLSGTASVGWTIYDANGTYVASGAFDNSSVGAIQLPNAGTYTLVLDAWNSQITAAETVSFRLLDLAAAAAPAAIGMDTTGSVLPGEAVVYTLTAQAGDSLVYVPTDTGTLTGQWALIDATSGLGVTGWQNISQGAASLDLPSTGSYFLIWDTNEIPGSPAIAYSINLKTVSPGSPQQLALNADVNGVLGEDGTLNYEFQVSRASLLWLDALSAVANLEWRITDANGAYLAGNTFGTPAYYPISISAADTYRLSFRPQGALPNASSVSFRLSDLSSAAVALTTDTETQAVLDPGSSINIYRFDALYDDTFQFKSYGVAPNGVTWRLYSQAGRLVGSGTVGSDSPVYQLSGYGSGRYYLLVDGAATNASPVSYAFAASLNRIPVALNTVVSGTASYYAKNRYTFHLDQATWVAFDAFRESAINYYYDAYAYWSLQGPSGQVFYDNLYYWGRDSMRLLDAGDYTLSVFSSYWYANVPYKFKISDATAATPLVPGATVTGTLNPGNTSAFYRLDATAGEQYYFRGISTINGYWRLIDPQGREVFNASQYSRQDAVTLQTTGSYLLAIEGANTNAYAQNYSFTVIKPTDKGSPAINSTVSDTAAAGSISRYQFHLDQRSWLVFDSLVTSSGLRWRLEGPAGNVFNQGLGLESYYYSNQDPMPRLDAGDYTLILENTLATAANYSFRILGADSATALVPGTPMVIDVLPANGVAVYRFDAQAGDRYYFDNTDNGYRYGGWRLFDPLGRAVFNRSGGYDVEPGTFTLSGTYLLAFEGDNANNAASLTFRFNVVPVPNNPPTVLDTLVVQPAPDLYINSVTLNPTAGLQTGQTVQVQWVVENRGVQSTTGSWNDRIVLRNLDNGELLASLTVPYDEAEIANGAIAPNESRTRTAQVRIPDGALAAGRVGVTVIADSTNVLHEGNVTGTGESNNSRSIEVQVALSPYADLVAEGVTLTPNGDFVPGATVAITWNTVNRGTADAVQSWSERVEIRNLSTNELIGTTVVADDVGINGILAPNSSRARAVQFVWPAGVSAAGRFSFRIVLDSMGEIPEANLTGTGETNNTVELIRLSGPDLRVKNLQVPQTTIEAGGLVMVNWEDWNDGAVPTPANFNDRIVVTNRTTGEKLLDTSLLYDAAQVGLGAIESGSFRARSFTFRLPDGLRGTGDIEIKVTSDQNSAGLGVLFETNLTNDAESNNSAIAHAQSAAKPYADLSVTAVNVPLNASAGSTVDISWTVANIGQAAATAGWIDRVVLSRDGVIGNVDDVILANVSHGTPVAIGDTYTQTATIRMPTRIQGNYYVGVIADALGTVIEPDTRSNNSGLSGSISVAPANADLVPELTLVPADATAGRSTRVDWTVQNQGTIPTDVNLWVDQLYLAPSQTLDGQAILLGSDPRRNDRCGRQLYVGAGCRTATHPERGDVFHRQDGCLRQHLRAGQHREQYRRRRPAHSGEPLAQGQFTGDRPATARYLEGRRVAKPDLHRPEYRQ